MNSLSKLGMPVVMILAMLSLATTSHAQHVAGMQTDQFYEFNGIKIVPEDGVGLFRNAQLPSIINSSMNSEGEWQLTGSMDAARRDHTSMLLSSGKVLIIDGTASGTELYDTVTGTFRSVSNSIFGHGSFATATQLLDGRVLLVGGNGAPSSAEIFDPSTETFSATGSLNEPHTAHSATLMADGKVLISGGQGGSPPVTHAHVELYDPATGTFVLVGSLNEDRSQPTATLLQTGEVLITGGTQTTSPGFGFALDSAELYDPDTQTFREVGSMAIGRTTHRAAMLHDGQVLIAGDLGNRTIAELYDPDLEIFHLTGESNFGRAGATATTLLDGQVLFVGGSIAIGPITTNTAELFDPQSGSFTPIVSMNFPRQQHRTTLLNDGRILVSGGFDGNMNVNSAELYQGVTNDIAEVTSFTLIDATTNQPIPAYDPIPENAVLNFSLLPRTANIRANTSGAVESVQFDFEDENNFHTENEAPYALYGDYLGDYGEGRLRVGTHPDCNTLL